MKKGEKLYKFLESKIDEYVSSPSLSPSSNTAEELFSALCYLKNMKDDEFDEIVKNKTNMSENIVVCSLCNGIVHWWPDEPPTQEELDEYICSECEDAVNDKRFY